MGSFKGGLRGNLQRSLKVILGLNNILEGSSTYSLTDDFNHSLKDSSQK